MMNDDLLSMSSGVLTSLVFTIFLCYYLQPVARRITLVDEPSSRKRHRGSVPLIGGLAMFGGVMAGLLISGTTLTELRSLIAGSAILLLTGVLDDLQELTARKKFAAQSLAVILMISWGEVQVGWIGDVIPDQNIFLGSWTWPFTFLGALAVINAVNMSDGMDGLAGSYLLIGFGSLAFLSFLSGEYVILSVLLFFVAALVGFLYFNVPFPWRRSVVIFMGDAGSLFLGFALAWFCIYLSQGPDRVMNPVVALWIVALPLFDVVGVTVRRLLKGRPVFAPDREHFHHILVKAGYGTGGSVIILGLFALIFAIVGIAGYVQQVHDSILFFGFIAVFLLYLGGMFNAWRIRKLIHRAGKTDRKRNQLSRHIFRRKSIKEKR